jgi:AAA domain
VPAEVDAVLTLVRALADQAVSGIGVITPFRAQADALEAALLEAFSLDEIERMALRIGTVHSFQGAESDHVVISLALTDNDSPARRRFVNDPNLFNVLVTRARRRLTVVTALTAADGLAGEYLAYSEKPPVRPDHIEPDVLWTRSLSAELTRAGLHARPGYPVGRWSVDLVVGGGASATGLICHVHPDGASAHIERQRTLHRAGWSLLDAFRTRWNGDPTRAAADLASQG